MNNIKKYFLSIFICFCLAILSGNKQYQKAAPKNTAAKGAEGLQKTLPPPGTLKQSDNIKKYSAILKKFFVENEPAQEVDAWKLPFYLKDRSDINKVKFIGGYGDYRSSRVAGHRHSGVDIIPADKNVPLDVYPSAKGIVCFVTQEAPVKTVIIRHKLKDGSTLYTSYIHLRDILIKNGQNVDEDTIIGVLYTKKEALKYGGNFDHLHFEVKKRIDDYSCASWLCMSKTELDEYFISPVHFFKTHLK